MEPWGPQPAGKASQTPGADYLGVVSRHRWLMILVIGWAVGLAAFYSFTRPTMYTAEAEVLIGPGITSLEGSTADVNPVTESQVLESTEVAQLVAARLDGDPSVESLLRNVSVDVPENTEILHIMFSARDPVSAKDGADAFADAYLEYRGQQFQDEAADRRTNLESELENVTADISTQRARLRGLDPASTDYSLVSERLNDLESQRSYLEAQLFILNSESVDPGRVIARAITPTSPSSPNHTLDLALGAIVGVGLAFGLAYIRDRKSTGFESASELEEVLGVPVMAVIPSFRDERVAARDPIALYRSGGPISDGYRTLRAAVLARAERSRLVTIAVTSARSGEGKSMTAAMLAIALASTGRRVVLIDGDLRRPMVSKLGIDDRLGLADVLAARVDSVLDTMQTTAIEGLSVVASGRAGPSSDPAELLQSDRMRKVLEDCGFADFVVLDTPAVLAVADALVLAPLTDGVLFVASAKDTTTQALDYGMLQLQRIGANIIGSVLIGVRRPEGQELGYYYRLDRPGVRINPLGRAPETDPRRAAERGSLSPSEPLPDDRESARASEASFLDEIGAVPEHDGERSSERRGPPSPQRSRKDEQAGPESPRAGATSPTRGPAPEAGAIDAATGMPPLPPPPPLAPTAPPTSAGPVSTPRSGRKKRRRAGTSKPSKDGGRVTASDPERTTAVSTAEETAVDRASPVPGSRRRGSPVEDASEAPIEDGVKNEDRDHAADDTSAENDTEPPAQADPAQADEDRETATAQAGTEEEPKTARAEAVEGPATAVVEPTTAATRPTGGSEEVPATERKGSSDADRAPKRTRSKTKGARAPRTQEAATEEREDPKGTAPTSDGADQSAIESGHTT